MKCSTKAVHSLFFSSCIRVLNKAILQYFANVGEQNVNYVIQKSFLLLTRSAVGRVTRQNGMLTGSHKSLKCMSLLLTQILFNLK